MNVGSYLCGKSAFTTHPNSHIFYGDFYGKTYGNTQNPPLSDEYKKYATLYISRELRYLQKVGKYFSESLRESINGINVVFDNSNPDDHSYHISTPYLLQANAGCLRRLDAFA